MKIKEALMYYNSLKNFLEKKLPIKISYTIAINEKALQNILDVYEKERIKLLKKYAEKDETGKIITDDKEQVQITNMDFFIKEFNSLLDIQQKININYITFSDLEDCNKEIFDTLNPKEIMDLDWMIKKQQQQYQQYQQYQQQ